MINNIRIKNQPLFKEFTFPEQEMKQFVLRTTHKVWDKSVGDIIPLHLDVLLTPFEYKILGKVFNYEPNSNIFTKEETEGKLREISHVLSAASEIIKVMSFDEVEFIEVGKETFDKWVTFREWCDIVGEDA